MAQAGREASMSPYRGSEAAQQRRLGAVKTEATHSHRGTRLLSCRSLDEGTS